MADDDLDSPQAVSLPKTVWSENRPSKKDAIYYVNQRENLRKRLKATSHHSRGLEAENTPIVSLLTTDVKVGN